MSDLPLILEPRELAEQLDNERLLVVDLSHPDRYGTGHIPGAFHVHPRQTQRGTPPAPGMLPMPEALQQLVEEIGLRKDHHVVVCDDEGGGWAGRFIWLLDCIGHRQYSYLNGGMLAWQDEDLPLSDERPTPGPSDVTVTIDSTPTATLEDVVASLDDKNTVIWDARSASEYRGERTGSARAGHIPGAINLEWTQTMDPDRAFRLRTDDRLKATLEKLGMTPDKRIITHCQSHHRSGLTYLVAKHLGYQVQGYDGSWAEWGNHPDTPIEI